MNLSKLIKKLKNSYLIRCKYWMVCGKKSCFHYEPHRCDINLCLAIVPVKYCGAVNGFVHDVPLGDLDDNYECDPNLAFKAKRDAEERQAKKHRMIVRSIRGGEVDDDF